MCLQGLSIRDFNPCIDRKSFNCGSTPLDNYLAQQVSQDVKRSLTKCYMLCDDNNEQKVAGFYTLSSAQVDSREFPPGITRKLPTKIPIPATRLGRLAIDVNYQRQGLGAMLIYDALKRTKNSAAASFALIVDAKDSDAEQFYEHHKFIRFPNSPNKLFLPIASVS